MMMIISTITTTTTIVIPARVAVEAEQMPRMGCCKRALNASEHLVAASEALDVS